MSGSERADDPSDELLKEIYADLEQRVHFSPEPRDKIDVLDLNDDMLATFKLPPRPPPDLAFARSVWIETMKELKLLDGTSVREFFRIDLTTRHKTERRAAVGGSQNWSGALLEVPADLICRSIFASWAVPMAQPGRPPAAILPGTQEWRGSCWVGLDGSGPGSVTMPQTGTTHIVNRTDGALKPSADTWWQWWIDGDPKNRPVILPIRIDPGQQVTAILSVRTPLLVNIFVKNLDNSQAASFDVSAPALPSFAPEPIEQQTMEWIVERQTEIGGVELLPFADYNRCDFGSCGVTLESDRTRTTLSMDVSDPITIEMTDWTNLNNPGGITSTYAGDDSKTVRVRYVR